MCVYFYIYSTKMNFFFLFFIYQNIEIFDGYAEINELNINICNYHYDFSMKSNLLSKKIFLIFER